MLFLKNIVEEFITRTGTGVLVVQRKSSRNALTTMAFLLNMWISYGIQ
jgi:hypothetical protein